MKLSIVLLSSLLLVGEGFARPNPAHHGRSLDQPRPSSHRAKRQDIEAQRFGGGRGGNRFRPNFGGFGAGAGASPSGAAPVASDAAAPVDGNAGGGAGQGGDAGTGTGVGGDAAAGGDGGGDTGAGADGVNGGDVAAGNGGNAGGDGQNGGDAATGGADDGNGQAGGDAANGGANGGNGNGQAGGDAANGGADDGNGQAGGEAANGGNGQAGGDAANGGNGQAGGDAANGANNGGNGGNNGNKGGNGGNGGGGNNAGNADDTADDADVAPPAGDNAQQPGPPVPVLVSNGGQTLDQGLIMNTQANANDTAGQAASAISNNNFIDFCQGQTLTNGLQVKGGSCAVTPIGQIPSTQNMVSTMFVVPANGDSLPADTTFTMQLAVQGMVMGSFTNAQANYYSAPQQVGGSGKIVGHAHVVIQEMTSTTSTQVLNPQQFAFFKGLNFQDVNGVSSLEIDGGLPQGAYRICTIMSASNHQSVVMPVAQRGAENTCSYFNTQ